jgi:DNA sulfur modification protein DndE
MENPIRTVRVSEDARDQLIRLKRYTGVSQWNVLCRWAFCRSLAEPHPPSPAPLGEMSNVEMTWAVFAGQLSEAFLLMLRQRVVEDGLESDDETVAQQFRLHLHRGIAYLAQEGVKRIDDLVAKAFPGFEDEPLLPLHPHQAVTAEG